MDKLDMLDLNDLELLCVDVLQLLLINDGSSSS